MKRIVVWLVFLLPIAAGCSRYVPARLGAVPSGAAVRVHLTSEGAQRVESVVGSQAQQLSGQLESWSPEVVLSVPVPAAAGMMDRGLMNRIILSPSEVVAIDVRERDRTRTAILTGGLLAGTSFALIAAFSGIFGGSRNNDPPIEEDFGIPIWLRVFPQ